MAICAGRMVILDSEDRFVTECEFISCERMQAENLLMPNQTFQPDEFDPQDQSQRPPSVRGDSTIIPTSTDALRQAIASGRSAADVDFAALSNVSLLRGRVIKDRYILDEHVAEGGFGAVFKGTDKRFPGKPVAIKLALDSETQKYFVREAKMMGQLKSDFVVDVYDYGFDRGIPYIVMEYLDGKTLEDLVHEHNANLPDELIAKCVDQVGRALESAHALNLVHRDLKPKNIMLVDCGDRDDQGEKVLRFKILDFGIASKTDAVDSVKNVTLNGGGTPEYMSPEQIRGADAAPTSDVYTFGVLIFQLLTGEVPFSNKNFPQFFDLLNAIVQSEAPRLSDRVGKHRHIPPALEQLVASCLEKDPQKRPSTIREVRHRYRRALNLGNSTTNLPTDYRPPRQRPKWLPWTVGGVCAVIVLAIVLMNRSGRIEIHTVPNVVQLEAGGEAELHLIAQGAFTDQDDTEGFLPTVKSAPEGVVVTVLPDHDEPGDRTLLVRSDLGNFNGDNTSGLIHLVTTIHDETFEVDVPIQIQLPKSLWKPDPLLATGGWEKSISDEVYPSYLTVPDIDLKLRFINPAKLNRAGPRYPFYVSVDCVSEKLYSEFIKETGRDPVESTVTSNREDGLQTNVSFLNCLDFVNWLNQEHPVGERGRFRMPTWNEWWASVGYFSKKPATGAVTEFNPFALENIAASGFEWTSTLDVQGRTYDVERDGTVDTIRTPGANSAVGPLTYDAFEGTSIGNQHIFTTNNAKTARSYMSFRIVFEPDLR